jgi:hypothetical protein
VRRRGGSTAAATRHGGHDRPAYCQPDGQARGCAATRPGRTLAGELCRRPHAANGKRGGARVRCG